MKELRSILPYFEPYRTALIVGLVCVFLANVFQIAAPYLMKLAIDGLGDASVTSTRIASLAALIVFAALVGGIFRYGMRELMNGISRRIEVDLRNDFFRHLLRLDAVFFEKTRTGDLMSRATNDTSAVRMAVGPAVMYTMNTFVSFVFTLAVMIWISPRLTLYAMTPMLVLPAIVFGFGRVIHRRFERIQEQFSSLSNFVQENLTGVRIIRAYTREKEQAQQFSEYNEGYRSRNMHLVLTTGAFNPMLKAIAAIAGVLVTWLGGLEVIAGRITLGDFVAFGFYLALLIWPMVALGWVINLYQRGAASMRRINQVFSATPRLVTPPRPSELEAAAGIIEFVDVSFSYPETDRAVLEGIKFVAQAGETVAIVGPTGSGKSTLLALLARLYDPTEGKILLDGIPLTELDPGNLRTRIGFVPQEAFLFSDSIAGNIGLGLAPLADTSREREKVISSAAAIAQLHEQVLAFTDQYDTILGERGINLSGGQKQRATLARALARDPLILVLDDALSGVDTQTEAAILKDLRSAMKACTTFIISHRVSAVMEADQILVLEEGRIVERGKHSDLISSRGTYARLLRRQLLEEGLEATSAL